MIEAISQLHPAAQVVILVVGIPALAWVLVIWIKAMAGALDR